MSLYKIVNTEKKKRIILTFKWLAIYLSVLLIVAAFYQGNKYWQEGKTNSEGESIYVQPELTSTEVTETTEPPATMPATYSLSVAYAPQAPFSNWTVHEESCEEAAIYMYRAYLEGLTYSNNRVPDAEADTVFRAMKSWQVAKYGSEPDLTMTALGKFANDYYGYQPTVKTDIAAEDIKAAIAAGHPVIVPVMTHSLENSMYGPISVYHVLLIKGYDETGVITNDAGVGNGVDHHYTWGILWQAIDAQSVKMNQGRTMLYLTD